ncbi:Eukaryotic translation initiation factor 5, partial [Fragariocoptes setiger]
MATLNINRNLSDQFYRYKMPKLVAKVEGKGNGIKTVIVNMADIAKSLNRPPMYPTKYFGCVLGAQVNFDNKSERYIVNGAHDANKLQDLLDGFISKYVLCQSCENPETILSVNKKKEIIGTNCMACGHAGTIPVVNDRLASYILKNPPPKPVAAMAPTAAAAAESANNASVTSTKSSGKSSRSKSSKNRPSTENNPSDHTNHHHHSNDNQDDTKDDDDDDEDWGEETGEDAVRKRMDQLSAGTKCLMLNDDLEKSQEERLQLFFEFVEKKAASSDLTNAENQKAIVAEAERLDISDKAVIVLCEVLLKDNLLEKVKLYKNLFLRFTHGNHKAQRYLLRGLELTISSQRDQLMPKVSPILALFYELSIIVEEVALEWYAKGQKKGNKAGEVNQEILEKASIFIKWLKEADTESDEDEDDEDANVNVDFDDRLVGDAIKVEEDKRPDSSTGNILNTISTTAAQSANGSKKPEDDIDIDAI